jgi:hypothetical protein
MVCLKKLIITHLGKKFSLFGTFKMKSYRYVCVSFTVVVCLAACLHVST